MYDSQGGYKWKSLLNRHLLYDFYGELLTERQQQVYEDVVVLDDYSLSEVAEDLGISRQGVHDIDQAMQSDRWNDYEAKTSSG